MCTNYIFSVQNYNIFLTPPKKNAKNFLTQLFVFESRFVTLAQRLEPILNTSKNLLNKNAAPNVSFDAAFALNIYLSLSLATEQQNKLSFQ